MTTAMIFEAMFGQEPAHADVNTWFVRIAVWVRPQNRPMLCRLIREQHDVDVMMKVRFRPRVPLHRQCHDTTFRSATPRPPIRNCVTWPAPSNLAKPRGPEKERVRA